LFQLRTFDQQLKPMKNVEVSINEREFVSTGNKGSAFVELPDADFPFRSIKIKDQQLEAASWNFSKGFLDVVVRKKNFLIIPWFVRDGSNAGIANVKITYRGKKTITAPTNAEGRFEIPLALDEKVSAAAQFEIPDYRIVSLTMSANENVLIAERIVKAEPVLAETTADKPKQTPNKAYFRDFNLSKLDSIQSLTVFYAIFKNYDFDKLDEETKQKVDAKFNQLVKQLVDSTRLTASAFIGRISDSSFVKEDIKNLLAHARMESQTLETQRTDFDDKIRVVKEKLAGGVESLDDQTRNNLLSDLTLLEQILVENESKFYKNQNDYREIINAIKDKYFDFADLENRLSESEALRLEEQRVFRQRLMAITAVVLVFAVLIIMLVSARHKLRKQKRALEKANAEIKRINENLESIVVERTKLLADAHKELDTFLYRASHDLRSPVCSIIGLCNIASLMSSGEARELIDRVVQTTIGMDKLLKKLSLISEINQPSNFSSISLLEVVHSTWHHYKKPLQDLNVNFIINCPADLMVFSYPNLIEAILANLIENALYYSMLKERNNARIEFTAGIKGDSLELILHDNGIGVDNTIHHRLFDMFFKGHETSKGNGLGLYIVHKSVQALGGRISVESEPQKFARFIVTLPLNAQAPQQAKLAGQTNIQAFELSSVS
jgi:signal transduction histidine kinase